MDKKKRCAVPDRNVNIPSSPRIGAMRGFRFVQLIIAKCYRLLAGNS
jgi:hypothetical protein